jgi:hypothetical protein
MSGIRRGLMLLVAIVAMIAGCVSVAGAQVATTMVQDTAMQVDAGMAPPAGGGFEVRLKDWEFGVGVDAADLVLRSPVRSFSIPVAAQLQRFYVRMYDASTPPLYSRFSSAAFVNMPVNETA